MAQGVLSSMKHMAKNCLGTENYYRLVVAWHKLNGRQKSLVEKAQDWKVYADDPRLDPVLKQMLLSCEEGQQETLISDYWKGLINKNVGQLLDSGFENFKQTVALNYFTWLLGGEDHAQIKFLKNALPASTVDAARKTAKASMKHPFFNDEQSALYNFVTLLLWEYVKTQGPGETKPLEEPLLGNPPALKIEGKLFSQDLGNAILEYQSILKGVGDFGKIGRILEIGAGYGRSSYPILKLNPGVRYIIADIPPALYISQRYLSELFKDRKIFMFRDFERFEQVRDEFMACDLAFIMPFQLEKLPTGIADAAVAIDCFHEMVPAKIAGYFKAIDRLAHSLYFKCWKTTKIPFDNITLLEKDYPIQPHWRKVYSRECRVQTEYFESFYSWERQAGGGA